MKKTNNKKYLVAYFSHSGRTREIAKQIQEKMGCDIFEIIPVEQYPSNYNQCVDQARKELDMQLRPSLKTMVENIDEFDIVFIGYPNWWGTIPMPVATFLTSYDFSGVTIAPFCTHGGGGLGRSLNDISKLCQQSTILEGLPLRSTGLSAINSVSQWIIEQKLLQQ